ncbi:MAG: serine hydrolase domain-containing protein, partial [Planctomycetota bacterium]
TAEREEVGEVERFEKGLSFKGRFRKGDAEKLGLDGDAIDDLVRRAAGADTDALLVMKDGKIVCERTFGRAAGPIHIMSVTKFVTAIAVGMLLEEKKIGSLDAPLSTWFPEWKEGERAKVTLRHVLTHTSGIAHQNTARELNQQTDKVAYVRRAKIAAAPGTVHSYNNDAVALLSGVLAKAAGRPVDAYLKAKLFVPIGIEDFKWDRDGAGNTFTYANLQMTARDLALVGQVVANGGKVGRKSLLGSKTISLFGSPATPLDEGQGLLWRLHLDEKGEVRAYYHTGWLGQHLLVYPREKLVAVRLRRWKNEREAEKPEFMLGSIRSLLDAALSR